MVRDDNLSKLRKKCGEKGGNPLLKTGCPNPYYYKENDILVNQKDNPPLNLPLNQTDNQKITPSSSSSSSTKSSNNKENSRELVLPILQSANHTPEKNALEKENHPAEPQEIYLTKKGRKLAGKKLEDFLRFWEAFGRHGNKAPAADSWLDIKGYSAELVEKIIKAAIREAEVRPSLLAKNQTPKYAQGWLADKRWDDEIPVITGNTTKGNGNGQRKLNEAELKNAQRERDEAFIRIISASNAEARSSLPN
jgi:hypothetical protein